MNKKQKKCVTCGAYIGHHPLCSAIDLRSAREEAKKYYEIWLNNQKILKKIQKLLLKLR